jgi:hypothetical protein
MTDDVANRRKAEKEGIACISGQYLSYEAFRTHSITFILTVRKYVEGLKDESAQLLDLLSATSGDDIEPTPAHPASRQALYPDVNVFSIFRLLLLTNSLS